MSGNHTSPGGCISHFAGVTTARGAAEASWHQGRNTTVGVSESYPASGEHGRPGVVLVTTDTEWSARSLETLLNPSGYVVVRAGPGRQIVPLAVTTKPDALILEHRLPALSAVDTMQWLRDDPRFNPGTPILVVSTGPIDRAQRLAIYNAGAWDHCTQPLDTEVLLRQLNTLIGVKRQIDRLNDTTLVDPATGLYSPRGLVQRAREVAAGAFRRREALACVAVALELEPAIEREDVIAVAIVSAARVLGVEWTRHGRATDVLGHVSSAEFGIVAAGTGTAGVRVLLDRLREHVDGLPVVAEGQNFRVRLRAESVAVDDYAAAPTDAVAMLRQASRTLRNGAASDPAPSQPL